MSSSDQPGSIYAGTIGGATENTIFTMNSIIPLADVTDFLEDSMTWAAAEGEIMTSA
jgi:hypothetical protein